MGRGGFCLRRQICIDCGQPLVHRRYVAVATVFGTHTQAVRSCSYNALKTLVNLGQSALRCIAALGTKTVRGVRYIDKQYRLSISTLFENIDIDIDIDMTILENIDIDKAILENIDIGIDIDIDIFLKISISIWISIRTFLKISIWGFQKILILISISIWTF